MGKRIVLDQAYIDRVRKNDTFLQTVVASMEKKRIPCKFCGNPTVIKFDNLTGFFQAKCSHCNQEAIYNAADYRHYSYSVQSKENETLNREYA